MLQNLLHFTEFVNHSWNLHLISLSQSAFYKCGVQEQLLFQPYKAPQFWTLLPYVLALIPDNYFCFELFIVEIFKYIQKLRK